jgi:hypothetical protein
MPQTRSNNWARENDGNVRFSWPSEKRAGQRPRVYSYWHAATLPKEYFGGQVDKEVRIDVLLRQIYDGQNDRCITVMYPDSEIDRKIISTPNIQAPQ